MSLLRVRKPLKRYRHTRQQRDARAKKLLALMDEFERMKRRDEDVPEPFGEGVLRGDRSSKDFKDSWVCFCGHVNKPWRRRLFDIPAMQCEKCTRADDVPDFDFVYDHTLLNGIRTIRQVRQQNEGECAPYAWTAAAEIDQAIKLALNGESCPKDEKQPPCLDAQDLVRKHKLYRKRILEANKSLDNFHMDVDESETSLDALELVGAVAKVCGIREKGPMKRTHTIAGCKKLDKNDFPEIVSAIANGPVVATLVPEESFLDLAYGQMYKAPKAEKLLRANAVHDSHAVVLVGAGKIGDAQYFHLLNSWGKKFCLRMTDNGNIVSGGIGMIRASDITAAVHLRRKVS